MSRMGLLSLVCAALSGCIGNGDPHHDHTLVLVEAEPIGAACKYGGTAIHTGVDANDNGTLEAAEFGTTEYICNASSTVKCIENANNVPGPITLKDAADFVALDGVQCIDGDLMIVGSPLATLPELTSLEIVTGSIIVAGNSSLSSLDGLPNVQHVGRKYIAQGNDSLVDISALGAMKRFQQIGIIGNDALVDLAGLDTFVEIEGGLQVSNNSNLTSLHGLENLTRGNREAILIRSNKNLTSMAALANLRASVLLEVSGNASLTSVSLPALEKVDVYISIKDNADLTTVSLPSLFTTGGLVLQTNPALTSVSAPELVLAGAVTFESDTSIAAISLPKLAYTTVNFDLLNLPVLAQASFPALVAIGGPLSMYQLPDLASLSGFANLSSIGGNLLMRQCTALQDFTGFTSLVDVANMTITENTALTAFTGLDSFTQVGGDLTIISNPNLAPSTAQAFASAITVVGTVTIN